MTILLQKLVEYAWVFYAGCAIGALLYTIRALTAQRERGLALFTLERETATSRVIQAWVMVLVFVVIGAAIFLSTTFVLPGLPIYNAGNPPPTATLTAGVVTPAITPTPSPALTLTPTFTPTAATVVVPTLPPPTQTPPPTTVPEAGISGELDVRFGNFAQLVGYSLTSAEVTTAQPVMLTLYWRRLEVASPANYVVFSHLLTEDGQRLIAQHDGAPAGGTRPLDTWTSNETIVDVHPMAFLDAAYTGLARVAVGLYDPATGRVPTGTGEDHVVLPITINVVSQ
jgi:hypothetical protein